MKHHAPAEWHRLFSAALDETITPAERLELQRVLKEHPEARQLWFLYSDNECSFAERRPGRGEMDKHPARVQRPGVWNRLLNPFTAMAAGLVIGLLSASMVFAYVSPRREPARTRLLPLADSSFEAGGPFLARGVPASSARWSGDYCQVVGAEQGVAPMHGDKMLRFLRSDSETTGAGKATYVGEAAQLIDLRPFRAELQQGDALVELSAWFQSVPLPGERYEFAVKAAAFHGELTDAPMLWEARDTHGSYAMRSAPATTKWQQVSTTVSVPNDADFLVIECTVARKGARAKQGALEFAGHYVDGVQVRLQTRNRVP